MANSRFKILIIEDEPGFRRTFVDLFRHHGHQVIEAADGEHGLSLALSEGPDVVLLDLIIPKLSGIEVLSRIKSDRQLRRTPVIIFSVLGEQTDIQLALQKGADDYIVKGFYSPAEVLNKIGSFLSEKKLT